MEEPSSAVAGGLGIDLMALRAAGLFRWSTGGRMVAVNQWNGGVPPRFHLGRTRGGNVCHLREDVAPAAARTLLALAAEEPPLDDAQAPPALLDKYLNVLNAGAEAGPRAGFVSGPVYWFEQDVYPQAETVRIGGGNASLLQGTLDDWLPDVPYQQPMVAVVENARAVAVCASVRITASSHEAGVESHPAHRRRGYATRAVAGWARAVRQQSAVECFYSTTWDNVASRRVAARLGLTLIGAEFSIA